MTRRRRSEMSIKDCHVAFKEFAGAIVRMKETSEDPFGLSIGAHTPADSLGICFLVKGNFGVAEDLFEAVRIMRGSVLPAKDSS